MCCVVLNTCYSNSSEYALKYLHSFNINKRNNNIKLLRLFESEIENSRSSTVERIFLLSTIYVTIISPDCVIYYSALALKVCIRHFKSFKANISVWVPFPSHEIESHKQNGNMFGWKFLKLTPFLFFCYITLF